jgi:hypothetical protein
LTGEVDACNTERLLANVPDPVMIAPLKVPSIDSELPMANTTCGWAGIATESGTCDTRMGVAVAPAAPAITAAAATNDPASSRFRASRLI